MANQFDVTIIGTGPGGYVCAIRCAQLGLKVAVVEKRKSHGGTCLNVGCIPSKALLHASELYAESKHAFAKMGIKAETSVDFPQMMTFKQEAIDGNTKGIDFLLKKNKVTVFHGTGKIAAPGKVTVGSEVIETKHIVIATGSDVAKLKGIDIDEQRIVSSTGALELKKVPAASRGHRRRRHRPGARLRLCAPGCQGHRHRISRPHPARHGCGCGQELPAHPAEAGLHLQARLQGHGCAKAKDKVTLTVEPAAGGAGRILEADVVLVAVGRVPYTEGLGLEAAGVKLDNRGRIEVDHHYATSVPGIYAIGDVIKGPMLAHKAEDEGIAMAEILAGQAGHVNYGVIPGVVYTSPEVAAVGKTEEELKAEGVDYKAGKFLFLANGRAKANQTTDGFVKVLADAKTDRVLGVHIVGPMAGELIHEAAVLMEFGGSAEDLARTCHAHPTLSEAVKEAALAVAGRAIHS
jgi:dihydrolipoamide dehydrogenase